MRQRNSRLSLQSREKRFQFAMLLCGYSIQRGDFRVELEVDRLVAHFVGALEIRPMAAGWITMAGALLVATLHHSFEYGSFAEVVELHDLLFEGFEALRILSDEGGQFLV